MSAWPYAFHVCVCACVNSLIDTRMAGAFAKDKKAAEAEQKKLDRAFINDDEEESGDEGPAMEQRRALRKRRLADSDEEEADGPQNAKGENKYKRLLAEDSDDEEAAPAAVSPAKKDKAADSDSGDESDSSHASQDSGRDVVLKHDKKDEQKAKEVAAGEGARGSGCGGGEEGVDTAPDGVLVVEYTCVCVCVCVCARARVRTGPRGCRGPKGGAVRVYFLECLEW